MQVFDLSTELDYSTRRIIDGLATYLTHEEKHPSFGQATTLADVAREIVRDEKRAKWAQKNAQYKRTRSF